MVPVDIAAIVATLVMLHLFFRKDIHTDLRPGSSESTGKSD